MSKLVASIVVSAFCFIAACGGGSPVDKMASHMEKVLGILESNKADPNKAAEAVTAYMKDNEAALKAAKDEAEKYVEEMQKNAEKDPEGAAKAMKSMMDKVGPLMERMDKLKDEAPELMKNEKVMEALRAMK